MYNIVGINDKLTEKGSVSPKEHWFKQSLISRIYCIIIDCCDDQISLYIAHICVWEFEARAKHWMRNVPCVWFGEFIIHYLFSMQYDLGCWYSN